MIFIIGCNSPQEYLNTAVDIMQENSINKYTINWDTLRNDVLEKGKDAKTIEDTYPIIQYTLNQLNDNHSRFNTAEEYKSFCCSNISIPSITSKLIRNNIGYIKIPGFKGSGSEPSIMFAKLIQNKIKELDNFNIQYWIIDLSDNDGGYVWPMLLGLGPILGEDTLGYLMDADSNYTSWSYLDGGIFFDNKRIMNLENPYQLKKRIKKLAVIIGRQTASAGEALVVSFKGSDNSCFIGRSTMGVSTGTTGYKLSDGAIIFVARTKFVDRNKNIYGESINPDIGASYWDATETAIKWINTE